MMLHLYRHSVANKSKKKNGEKRSKNQTSQRFQVRQEQAKQRNVHSRIFVFWIPACNRHQIQRERARVSTNHTTKRWIFQHKKEKQQKAKETKNADASARREKQRTPFHERIRGRRESRAGGTTMQGLNEKIARLHVTRRRRRPSFLFSLLLFCVVHKFPSILYLFFGVVREGARAVSVNILSPVVAASSAVVIVWLHRNWATGKG